MTILTPVPQIPPNPKGGKYADLMAKIDSVPWGQWLPIECGDERERDTIRVSLDYRGYETHVRGLTVYARHTVKP